MFRLSLILKKFLLIFLGVSACVATTGVVIYKTHAPQTMIKEVIEKEFTKAFNWKVTIGELSGNLVTGIQLKDIRFSDHPLFPNSTVISIDHAAIYYNPIKALKKKGDFAAAAYRIDLENAHVHVLRDERDLWNVLELIPKPPTGNKPAPPPTFVGKIFAKNLQVSFEDRHGWGKALLGKPFKETFIFPRGSLDFAKLKAVRFAFQGPTKLYGKFNAFNGQYECSFDTELNLNHWGNYVFPIEGFSLSGDVPPEIHGDIRSKFPYPKPGVIPFLYDISIRTEETNFKMPPFLEPITQIKARANFVNGRFIILDSSSELSHIPLEAKGEINLNTNQMEMNVNTSLFDLGEVTRLFESIRNWKLTGPGTSTLKVYGAVNAPEVDGVVVSDAFKLYGFTPEKVTAHYHWADRHLSFDVQEGTLYGGKLTGNGVLNLTMHPGSVSLTIGVVDASALQALPNSRDVLSGNLDVTTVVTGNISAMSGVTRVIPRSLTVMNQSIDSAVFRYSIFNQKDIEVHHSSIFANKSASPLSITGRIHNLEHVDLHYFGQNILAKGIFEDTAKKKSGVVSVSGDYSTHLTPRFWDAPIKESRTTADMVLSEYPLYDSPLDRVEMNVSYDKGKVHLWRFASKNGPSELSASGSFEGKKIHHLLLGITTMQIPTSSFFQKYLPDVICPFGGILSANLDIRSKTSDAVALDKLISGCSIKGNVAIEEGYIQNQPFDTFSTLLEWQDKHLILDQFHYHYRDSDVYLSGKISDKYELDLNILDGTLLDMKDFQTLLTPFGSGKFSGQWRLIGTLKGTPDDPLLRLWVDGKQVKSRFLSLDMLKGQVSWAHHNLSAENIVMGYRDSFFAFSGSANLEPIYKDPRQWRHIDYDMELAIKDSDLQDVSAVAEGLYQEIQYRLSHKKMMSLERVSHENISLEDKVNYHIEDKYRIGSTIQLYKSDQTNTSLGFFNSIELKQALVDKTEALGLNRVLSGKISASISAKSRKDNTPLIEVDVTASNAQISFLDAKYVRLGLHTDGSDIRYTAKIEKGSLGAETFQEISSSGWYGIDGNLNISNTNIVSSVKTNKDVLKGYLPLRAYWDAKYKHRPLHLETKLQDNDISILALFNKNIKKITNKGNIALTLDGTLEYPVLNSTEVTLKDAQLHFADSVVFDQPFFINSDKITVKNNLIDIPKSEVKWRRRDDEKRYNLFHVAGNIDIHQMNLLNPKMVVLDVNLSLDPTTMTLDLPTLYRGKASLGAMKVRGPYYIPIAEDAKRTFEANTGTDKEDGPVISGALSLYKGELILPSVSPKTIKPSYLLDLQLGIGADMHLSGGLLGEGLIAGLANYVSWEIAQTKSPLIITGSLNAAKIQNKVYFEEGSLTLLNREFTILNEDKQRLFYKENQYKVHPNTMSFTTKLGVNGKKSLNPILNITASSVIERQFTTSSNSLSSTLDTYPYQAVLISINGSIYNLDTLQFEKFRSVKLDPISQGDVVYENTYQVGSKQSGQINQDSYQIFSLLLPDLVNSDLGQTTGDDQTKRLINVVGENQINSVFRKTLLRPVERRIAKNIGLYDLRVDYNVGKAVLKSASDTTGYSGLGSNETVLGVNFMQQLMSDRLFLRVKTDLDLKSEGDVLQTLSVSEVELRYYLLNSLSMTFSNIRESNEQRLRPKFTLKYSYEY